KVPYTSSGNHTFMGSHIPICCSIIPKGQCENIFIATLFILARSWKQTLCPSNSEWIKKIVTFNQWINNQL
ncbi:hypothetical protein ACQP3C_29445, partial [Escherichia coli]